MTSGWFESAAPGDSVAAIADLPNPFNEAAGMKISNRSGKRGVCIRFPKFKMDAE